MRLTPACAGKTATARSAACRSAAHPRVCGENVSDRGNVPEPEGSPPRVRGKRVSDVDRVRDPRLTPACAGKTVECFHCGSFVGAHPRVCGENVGCKHNPIETTGSPPRVRGKPLAGRDDADAVRLTPACAGKTSRIVLAFLLRPAHPRVCGENALRSTNLPGVPGSSPRVRGKPLAQDRQFRDRRLIPARAGKTRAGYDM